MKRAGVITLAALALACGGTSSKPGARLSRPAAIAVALMRTAKVLDPTDHRPAVHPYFAVASARADELTLFDAWDDGVVLAPIAFYPLTVPTPTTRPAMLAVAPVPDPAGPAPDALVVVPTGGTELDLVDTWSGTPRVVGRLAIDTVAVAGAGSAILSILGIGPVQGASGSEGRFLAGVSGGRLLVVDVTRDATTGALAFGAPTVKTLGFDAVSLAAAPGDLTTVYAASPDPIGGVFGAAAIDVTPAVGDPWPVQALDARAPTIAVAAFDVVERSPLNSGPFAIDSEVFGATATRRVYAALDSTACGPDDAISCGIAILDPAAGGLAADPAGQMPFAAPIPVPGSPTDIVPVSAPAYPLTCPDPQAPDPAFAGCLYLPPTLASGQTDPSQSPERRILVAGTPPAVLPMLPLAAGAGVRWTPAAAAVPSSDGATYLVDLGRYGLPPERSVLRGTTRTMVTQVTTGPIDATTKLPVRPRIGLVLGAATATPENELIDPIKLAQAIDLTPGYTPADSWHVVWQGALPNLLARAARLVRTAAGLTVPIHVPYADAPAGAPAYLSVVQVYDPRLGIHAADTSGVGDVVEVTVPADIATAETAPGSGVTVCQAAVFDAQGNVTGSKNATSAVTFEARVASLAPPAADHPGGALVLDGPGAPGPLVAGSTLVPGACDFASAQQDPTVQMPGVDVVVNVRASGLVLYGDAIGYAGRPALGSRYALSWQSEDGLLPSCPILAGSPAAACDAACRSACESLVLARKSRRLFYLDDTCPKASADPTGANNPDNDPCIKGDNGAPGYWSSPSVNGAVYTFPQPIGPVVAFQPVTLDTAECPGEPTKTCVVTSTAALARDTFLGFVTQRGGTAWMARRPMSSSTIVGAAAPTGATAFDRSVDPSRVHDGMRFLVAYPDNLVLDFPPGTSTTGVVVIR